MKNTGVAVNRRCWRSARAAATPVYVDPVECIAAVLGLVNIVLLVRRSIWNYPFAIAMVLLYLVVFYDAKLYSDALLQIFFLVVNIYGWIYWRRSQAADGLIESRSMPWRDRLAWALGCAAATAAWGYGMARYTDAVLPWSDAWVAIASVIAQILLSRRYWENWVLWIAIDIVSIANYAVKGLHVTIALYGLFLLLSIWGLVEWRRTMMRVRPA